MVDGVSVYDLTIEDSPIFIGDRRASAITINGTVPGPLLRLYEGQDILLRVTNRLREDTSIHWHGVLVPEIMDGVPGVSFSGILAGTTFEYRFRLRQYGTYDEHLLDELRTLRFVEQHHHVLLMGPVGVGKTMLAHALGHLAIAREPSVHCSTTDKLFRRLRASRLDGTYDKELRRLCQVDLLIIDDLVLQPMDERETMDLYELVTARHRTASMIVTSNRDPSEWLALLADPMHAQALVDRFVNNAYDLVVEGESYRKRQKPRAGVA